MVTERICNIGQNVLQYSFQTEVAAVQVTFICSSLLHSSRMNLLEI